MVTASSENISISFYVSKLVTVLLLTNLRSMLLSFYLPFSIAAPFYRYFKLLKTKRKGNTLKKGIEAIKLGTSNIEDQSALTDCAKSLLLETLADLKRDQALTLQKIL